MLHATLILITPMVVQARIGRGFRTLNQEVEAKGSLQAVAAGASHPLVTVKLQRVNNFKQPDVKGTYYVGHMSIGRPGKDFSVLFHTLSASIMVPHISCKDKSCIEHNRFSPSQSSSAIDVNLNGSRVTMAEVTRQEVTLGYNDYLLGAGDAKAFVLEDRVCLQSAGGEHGCVDTEFLAATMMSDAPFRKMPSDGIVGLGLEALGELDPGQDVQFNPSSLSFFGRFIAGHKGMLPQFGFSLGSQTGEIHFGGFDESRFIPPLQFLPIELPAAGFWQVRIRSVRIGSTIVDSCDNGCLGVVDTGSSLLGVTAKNLVTFKAKLASHVEKEVCEEKDEGQLACIGSELIFDLGDFTLALPPDDYTDADCVPELGPVDTSDAPKEMAQQGVYEFGAPLLRHYYAAFDWHQKRIGFARTSGAVPAKSTKTLKPKAKGFMSL